MTHECRHGCLDPRGKPVKMTIVMKRWDIIAKKERNTVACPVCRRWTFE